MPDEPAFEWDEAKSLENLRGRGFDFEFAHGYSTLRASKKKTTARITASVELWRPARSKMASLLWCTHGAAKGGELFPRGPRRGKNAMTTAKRTRAEIRKRGGGHRLG